MPGCSLLTCVKKEGLRIILVSLSTCFTKDVPVFLSTTSPKVKTLICLGLSNKTLDWRHSLPIDIHKHNALKIRTTIF